MPLSHLDWVWVDGINNFLRESDWAELMFIWTDSWSFLIPGNWLHCCWLTKAKKTTQKTQAAHKKTATQIKWQKSKQQMHTESYNIDRGRQSSVRTAQVHKPQLWHKVEYMIIFFIFWSWLLRCYFSEASGWPMLRASPHTFIIFIFR